MNQEQEIKKFLLPYQAILKLSNTDDNNDDKPMIPEPPRQTNLAWRELEFECEYDGYTPPSQ